VATLFMFIRVSGIQPCCNFPIRRGLAISFSFNHRVKKSPDDPMGLMDHPGFLVPSGLKGSKGPDYL
jgi:hypothetical protein